MPEVSVVVPVYNGAEFVAEALDSILAQTYSDYEILVVNDGSVDRTREVLAPYAERIRYLEHPENGGVSAALNTGIGQASGAYLGMMNADDLWLPRKLEQQICAFRAWDDADVVYTHYHKMTADGSLIRWPRRKLRRLAWQRASEHLFETLLEGNFIDAITPLCRRTWLEEVGLFDESLQRMEDWDVWLRMSRAGARFRFLDEVTEHAQAGDKEWLRKVGRLYEPART